MYPSHDPVFTLSIFGAVSIISTLAGAILTSVLTRYLKRTIGLQHGGSVVLAFLISIFSALVAYVVILFVKDYRTSWEAIPQLATQIFTVATIYYLLAKK